MNYVLVAVCTVMDSALLFQSTLHNLIFLTTLKVGGTNILEKRKSRLGVLELLFQYQIASEQ